jgi:hypothetical protein
MRAAHETSLQEGQGKLASIANVNNGLAHITTVLLLNELRQQDDY